MTEYESIRVDAQSIMFDRCQVGTSSSVADGVYTDDSYSYGSVIACGYEETSYSESQDGAQRVVNTIKLRLPYGTIVSTSSTIKMTKLASETLSTTLYYRVTGVKPNVAWVTATLERVVGNGQ